MSKAILEFNLADPDDYSKFRLATMAQYYLSVLQELDESLRWRIKYEDLTEDVRDELDSVRATMFRLLQENDISLDD
jgi:hypothetical protein